MSTKAQAFRRQQQRDANPPKPKQPKRRRDFPVDTSLPGVSATDRKARAGASGSLNESARAEKKGGARLETSAGSPSRKSTRKSVGRAKAATSLRRSAVRKETAPKTRAAKVQAPKTRSKQR